MRHTTDLPSGHPNKRAIVGLLVLVFIGGLGALAALVPVGHGFVPKGGGWFIPAVVGGAFTLHPLLVAVPWAACFVLGLLDWRRPWRVEHLDLLALAGFFPVAMLLSDDVSQAGLWLAAVCLGWLFCPHARSGLRDMADAGTAPVHQLPVAGPGDTDTAARPDRQASPGGNIPMSGRRARSAPGACCTDCTCTGRCPGTGPGGLRIYRPDSYGPFAYYAYIPFVAVFPPAPARDRDAAAGGVLRRADARRAAHARPAARRAAARAGVRVRVPALPVPRPLLDGADQRRADRRPLRMDNRRGGGASGRSRAAHGGRRPDQVPPRAARTAVPGRADGGARATR